MRGTQTPGDADLKATGLAQEYLDTFRVYRDHPNFTFKQVGEAVGVTAQTAKRRVRIVERALNGKGLSKGRKDAVRETASDKLAAEDPETFAQAVSELSVPGARVAEVARKLGLKPSLATSLARNLEKDLQPLKRTVAAIRLEDLQDRFGALSVDALDAITQEKLDASNARDLAIISGVAADKWQLLRGQPTQRMEIGDRRQMDEVLQLILKEAKRRNIEIDVTPEGEVLAKPSPFRSAAKRDLMKKLSTGDPVDTLRP